jgi:hypothetical protein
MIERIVFGAARVGRRGGDALSARLGSAFLGTLDAALRSELAETAVDRVLASRLAQHAVERAIDGRLLDQAVERLLESDDLWLLVDEIARSPAVTDAIAHQSAGVADEVGAVVRQRSRSADDRLERIARRLLGRRAIS